MNNFQRQKSHLGFFMSFVIIFSLILMQNSTKLYSSGFNGGGGICCLIIKHNSSLRSRLLYKHMLCLQTAHFVLRVFPRVKLETPITFRVEAQISFLWQYEVKYFYEYKKNHGVYGCSPNASLYIDLPLRSAPWALSCTIRKVYKSCHRTFKPGKHNKLYLKNLVINYAWNSLLYTGLTCISYVPHP